LIPAIKNYISQRIFHRPVREKESAEAYDLWSSSYDSQPGNLMLDLDDILFSKLLLNTDLHDKAVADIGCGTGRHWRKIQERGLLSLTGFDVSEGMLRKLREKYPEAAVFRITDDKFEKRHKAAFDVILSTLTIAHVKEIEETLNAWCSLLKPHAEIIITDYHPKMLAFGGKRTFSHNHAQMAVRNYVYHISTMKDILHEHGFRVVTEDEFRIDETVKHYYTNRNALPLYEQFKGFPVIYGIYLKR